jgi:NitT/TauT family transport system permease protein
MPLIVFHTKRVREALEKPAGWGIDFLMLGAIAAIIGAFFKFTHQVVSPYHESIHINLSFWALPMYTFFSLSRGFAAYILSLVFTLIYGTIAAHNHRAERIMIPALDVLQAIPVLAFLPGLVLAMISLFPTREIGLELACVIMIFTGQVWNMTFSFHGSLRAIPAPLREVAKIQGLTNWQTFKLLEVPAAMIGLVWNSMMSMAGGWFFLTVTEAFQLGHHDFRLPGIGSYMYEAIDQDNKSAMVAAIVAMTVMIVVVDQVIWRPIVVWAQRFKMEESMAAETPQSWLLNLLSRSQIYTWIKRAKDKHEAGKVRKERPRFLPSGRSDPAMAAKIAKMQRIAAVAFQVALGALILWGAWALIRLLVALPVHASDGNDYVHVFLALLASFGRTTAAVLLGVVWTLPVGILIGLSPRWSRRLQPIIQVVASFPAPMVFPLVVMLLFLFHIPFTIGCVALMLLGAQWYILFNVIAGATAIPNDLKEVTTVYDMSRWEKWKKLYLPCVFPYLVTGLVTAAGGAWNATIVAEYLPIKKQFFTAFGLGSMISIAQLDNNYPLLTAAVVTMALAVVLINRLIWKKLYHLAEERYSLMS